MLYKRVEPVEVSVNDKTIDFSKIAEKNSSTTNTLNNNSTIARGHLSCSDSDVIMGSKTA